MRYLDQLKFVFMNHHCSDLRPSHCVRQECHRHTHEIADMRQHTTDTLTRVDLNHSCTVYPTCEIEQPAEAKHLS